MFVGSCLNTAFLKCCQNNYECFTVIARQIQLPLHACIHLPMARPSHSPSIAIVLMQICHPLGVFRKSTNMLFLRTNTVRFLRFTPSCCHFRRGNSESILYGFPHHLQHFTYPYSSVCQLLLRGTRNPFLQRIPHSLLHTNFYCICFARLSYANLILIE